MDMDAIQKRLQGAFNTSTVGLILWALCIQYYLLQVLVAWVWKVPYSLTQNTISDLGNTACGMYGSRFVCSPLHEAMNISFVVLGTLMVVGSILLYRGTQKSFVSLGGFSLILVAGLGALLVGLFPENTVSTLHIIGAGLSFVAGNVGLLFFGFVAGVSRSLRLCALIFGVVALCALVAFLTHQYFGIGIGGMERLVAYPQTIWLIVLAVCTLQNRHRHPT
jgi:hypothetical membrane protein